jgi:hypothetical protein
LGQHDLDTARELDTCFMQTSVPERNFLLDSLEANVSNFSTDIDMMKGTTDEDEAILDEILESLNDAASSSSSSVTKTTNNRCPLDSQEPSDLDMTLEGQDLLQSILNMDAAAVTASSAGVPHMADPSSHPSTSPTQLTVAHSAIPNTIMSASSSSSSAPVTMDTELCLTTETSSALPDDLMDFAIQFGDAISDAQGQTSLSDIDDAWFNKHFGIGVSDANSTSPMSAVMSGGMEASSTQTHVASRQQMTDVLQLSVPICSGPSDLISSPGITGIAQNSSITEWTAPVSSVSQRAAPVSPVTKRAAPVSPLVQRAAPVQDQNIQPNTSLQNGISWQTVNGQSWSAPAVSSHNVPVSIATATSSVNSRLSMAGRQSHSLCKSSVPDSFLFTKLSEIGNMYGGRSDAQTVVTTAPRVLSPNTAITTSITVLSYDKLISTSCNSPCADVCGVSTYSPHTIPTQYTGVVRQSRCSAANAHSPYTTAPGQTRYIVGGSRQARTGHSLQTCEARQTIGQSQKNCEARQMKVKPSPSSDCNSPAQYPCKQSSQFMCGESTTNQSRYPHESGPVHDMEIDVNGSDDKDDNKDDNKDDADVDDARVQRDAALDAGMSELEKHLRGSVLSSSKGVGDGGRDTGRQNTRDSLLSKLLTGEMSQQGYRDMERGCRTSPHPTTS